mmetsp:Transcript_20206/g.52133  ORF Transcript_20206/g.52133 Transcript_20206/m.52133 type:complete len:229 (+) Transcript_20206:33-719(+)|eukprot:CAMPEP_0119406632 /NCGR_PEP_ID=MMETSP1335-20130426/884_1 /TAXON_ID=259385 /ORGANISM="Chrysoculter rhomboideus, Strain RCC1486" /LENGTH=228 /DNA_ID=CAMNT_0007430719 /DNA_START=27 /DNA_END=713 /DNA_ORIENTATION=+
MMSDVGSGSLSRTTSAHSEAAQGPYGGKKAQGESFRLFVMLHWLLNAVCFAWSITIAGLGLGLGAPLPWVYWPQSAIYLLTAIQASQIGYNGVTVKCDAPEASATEIRIFIAITAVLLTLNIATFVTFAVIGPTGDGPANLLTLPAYSGFIPFYTMFVMAWAYRKLGTKHNDPASEQELAVVTTPGAPAASASASHKTPTPVAPVSSHSRGHTEAHASASESGLPSEP